jgi:hypothetical protein
VAQVDKEEQNGEAIWAGWMRRSKEGIDVDVMDDTKKRPGMAYLDETVRKGNRHGRDG